MVGKRFDRLSKLLDRFTTRRLFLQEFTAVLVSGKAARGSGKAARGSADAAPADHTASGRFAPSSQPDDVLLAYWRRAGGERSWLGSHISGPAELADGEVAYFARGALWRGNASYGEVVASTLHPPLMGCPDVCTPDGALLKHLIQWGTRPEFPISAGVAERILEFQPNLYSEIWDGRLALRPVRPPGAESEIVSLRVSPPVTLPDASDDRPNAVQDASSAPDVALRNRTLYDIVTISGAMISPSALYARDEWTDFTFIHATDLHVSRRTDLFWKALRESPDADVRAGADKFVNYNNGLRDLIRYANALYDRGLLDFILMTGDLVDYIYEDPYLFNPPTRHPALEPYADRNGGGNFEFFHKILLGEVDRPEGEPKDVAPYDRLRAPIYMTLGNHDYRVAPYLLRFRLDVDVPATLNPLKCFGIDSCIDHVQNTFQDISNYGSHNHTKKE